MKVAVTLIVLTSLLAFGASAHAANYVVGWNTVSSGGGASSSSHYSLEGTVGQPAASFADGNSNLHWIGFWSSDLPVPTLVADARSAKTRPNGAFVSIAGRIAGSALGDFGGFFYLGDPEARTGIRVAAPPAAVEGLQRGSIVNVIGAVGMTPSGEKEIVAPLVIVGTTATPLGPVMMNNRAIGGADSGIPPDGQYGVDGGIGLNNIGMLVKAAGWITGSGNGYIEIDDGAGPVRIDTSTLASPPATGVYAVVTGFASLYDAGGPDPLRKPLILPRNDSDIEMLSH